jgi:hypothetical protein
MKKLTSNDTEILNQLIKTYGFKSIEKVLNEQNTESSKQHKQKDKHHNHSLTKINNNDDKSLRNLYEKSIKIRATKFGLTPDNFSFEYNDTTSYVIITYKSPLGFIFSSQRNIIKFNDKYRYRSKWFAGNIQAFFIKIKTIENSLNQLNNVYNINNISFNKTTFSHINPKWDDYNITFQINGETNDEQKLNIRINITINHNFRKITIQLSTKPIKIQIIKGDMTDTHTFYPSKQLNLDSKYLQQEWTKAYHNLTQETKITQK